MESRPLQSKRSIHLDFGEIPAFGCINTTAHGSYRYARLSQNLPANPSQPVELVEFAVVSSMGGGFVSEWGQIAPSIPFQKFKTLSLGET